MGALLKLKVCLVSFGLFLFSSSVLGGSVATVYFVPFEIETYVPITRDTIISDAWEKWSLSSESEASRLLALLNHGNQDKFDEGNVRALVLYGHHRYFVDSNGVALGEKSSVKIDKARFVSFGASLRADQRQTLKKPIDMRSGAK